MNFDTATTEELNRWYEEECGYRPQVDCPEMPDDELRKLCRNFAVTSIHEHVRHEIERMRAASEDCPSIEFLLDEGFEEIMGRFPDSTDYDTGLLREAREDGGFDA